MSVTSGGADHLSAPPVLPGPPVAPSTDPRDRRADCRQRPHRAAERQHRATVVRCAERLRAAGMPRCAAARTVGAPERTLRDWRDPRRVWAARRGRRPLVVARDERNAVLRFVHHVAGAAVGLAALVALFPRVPRCILADLLRRYRQVWRVRYRRLGFRLFWHGPGRVWAMDHSRATHGVDGVYPQIFAVRDLAAHEQLTWVRVQSTDGEEVRASLGALFDEHDPPLVMKSDNGSAFQAEETRAWLLARGVLPLFSPPAYPQYNGQLERSNAVNKTYTHQHAVVEGHPDHWISADLDAARELTNTISRPWGARGPTPNERWAARTPITPDERAAFAAAVDTERAAARSELGYDPARVLTSDEADEVDRRAIGRALERCGYLTKQAQQRAPRPRRRRRRASLERALRQMREASAAPPDADHDPPDTTDSHAPRPQRATSRGCASPAPCHESPPALLALPRAGDTMTAVVDEATSDSDSRPPPCAAQRERPLSSWWRSPITLVISLAKTAKFSR